MKTGTPSQTAIRAQVIASKAVADDDERMRELIEMLIGLRENRQQ